MSPWCLKDVLFPAEQRQANRLKRALGQEQGYGWLSVYKKVRKMVSFTENERSRNVTILQQLENFFYFWKCDLLKSSYPLRCPRPSLINRRLLSQSKSLSFLFFTAAMPNNSQIHQRYITVAHTTPPRCWKMHEAPQTDTHHSTQAILSSFSENWTWPFLESDVE